MLTKLKYLKAFWRRDVLPVAGATVGTILYTALNETGRRSHYIIDLDTDTVSLTTIDAAPADPTTMPGQIVVQTGLLAPGTDKNLLLLGDVRTITAVIDAITVLYSTGFNGATNIINVLDNDTLLDTNLDTVTGLESPTVTVTTVSGDAELTLNSDGSVDIAEATDAGTYEITYKIVQTGVLPENASTNTLTVTVSPALVLDANDDAITVSLATGVSGDTGIINVLTNDTIGGNPATLDDVSVNEVSSDPELTLNPDGSIDLAAGTAPGDYTVVYNFTETLTGRNSANATVTVTVDVA